MDLPRLKTATAALAVQALRPGTTNHVWQSDCFIKLCYNYRLSFINPVPSTLCYYITHLSATFRSSKSVRNYESGVLFLHKEPGLAPEALDSFPVSSLPYAADLTMRSLPLCQLPIILHLLTQLCKLSTSLGSLGPPMKVCLTFGFLAMLRQSNLAPLLCKHLRPH